MADIVIDTSTVLKWYIPEQHHSGNSAEAHPFRGGRKRVSCTAQTTEHSIADSPTLFKNINKENTLL
jgi:hypothetical protein